MSVSRTVIISVITDERLPILNDFQARLAGNACPGNACQSPDIFEDGFIYHQAVSHISCRKS